MKPPRNDPKFRFQSLSGNELAANGETLKGSKFKKPLALHGNYPHYRKIPCLETCERIFFNKTESTPRRYTVSRNQGEAIMSDPQLKEHLESLHTELLNTKTVDNDTKVLLQEIREDVGTLLEHEGEYTAEHHATIKERLDEAARDFDVSHPKLAATLRTVVSTLNNMGI
jgi:hypothetical protein